MASEGGSSAEASSFVEALINSRNRDISRFLPFFLGLTAARSNQETDDDDGDDGDDRGDSPDRIVLINPITQGMVVIERRGAGAAAANSGGGGSSLGFDSFFNDLFSSKGGHPPASKASIDAMETVEIGEEEGGGDQCVVCLEEWAGGEKAKAMPCKHRFHGECIDKWLRIHGSCPVCRYEMPVEEEDGEKKRRGEEEEGEGRRRRRREIWVSFVYGSGRRSDEQSDQSNSTGTGDSLTSD